MTYYPNNPYQQPREPAGLSTASLVLGILSMLGFCIIILVPLAGVITGHLAQRREPSSRGLSLAGLITSWVGLVIAVLLYAFIIWLVVFSVGVIENYEVDYSGLSEFA
ncbi:hypothetical protein CQ010_15190 [Arthrobacter sp. MYb211]|uniref:DUF4190 domain-containing protein n=1 Tax=Micrococcaceae TaxID=1268 RepID=UPI000CFC477C|nr:MULTISPECIES: DUF4190 domain-containing protein [unclassified Arthrobacter]PQZ97727.1 hypothetical protein CQ017_13305 [Arthrobacter sp. MYb224]PRA04041.1 hypothetical protein CQ019_06725 [Arthrobacter sp. MYb229]PRA10161.1 hypothetical protein CQ015_15355 [Arthrobacter sp. MYb221]PRB52047.1 hypothetical protein CQ013_09855 [Arthrobacter sp. MYb216]PRC05406.1 hypothetical protein CQ010_15190 [Arthrobacter sp. MYb211]